MLFIEDLSYEVFAGYTYPGSCRDAWHSFLQTPEPTDGIEFSWMG